MANAQFEVLEFRAVIKPQFTELYVLCGPTSDGTPGVQGWHKKTIGKDEAALPTLQQALLDGSYLTKWDIGIPD